MQQNVNISTDGYPLNNEAFGHVKVWKVDTHSGAKELLVDKKNLIIKTGADILASALAGVPNSKISHFYVGYTVPATTPSTVAITTDSAKTDIFPTDGAHGYLRIPLAFAPSFTQETGYNNNVVYFTTFITNGGIYTANGATFTTNAHLYSLALVNAQNPSGSNQDRIFSAINFGPVTYDDSHGLAIAWGITFRAL